MIRKVLETLFNIITRKLEVNEELTFNDKFFDSIPDSTPLTSQFLLMQAKIYISSVIWLVEKQEPKPLSKLFQIGQQEQNSQKIDFLRPKSFTREFSKKCYFTGITFEQRLDLIGKINFECFQRISNRLYVGDYFQKSLNHVIEQRARVSGVRLGDKDPGLIIQI